MFRVTKPFFDWVGVVLSKSGPLFAWVGVILSAVAALTAAFGSNQREAEMTQAVALGVAALACFRASEFFADKEK